METKKILIVEDDDFLRSLAVSKLEKAAYNVVTAADGEQGLSIATAEKPNLIILDLMLPGMSGFDVLEAIRKDDGIKNTKIIVFSNLGEEADVKRCTDLGVADYLVKANFTLDELVEKVSSHVA
jgi:DNA-binding response OmpR family regulator